MEIFILAINPLALRALRMEIFILAINPLALRALPLEGENIMYVIEI
jgi:hypothetical protein